MAKMKWCPYCSRMVGVRKAAAPWGVSVFLPILLFLIGLVLLPLAVVLWPMAVLCSVWGHLGLKTWCGVCSAPGKKLLPAQPSPVSTAG